jgi:uncharacterized protein (TIGR03086 family)
MDKVEALEQAIEECDKRLVLIDLSDWDLPTPCDEWSVRDLVYHIAWGSALYANLATGRKFDDLPELPTRENVDPDPVAHCRQQAAALVQISRKPGTMEVTSDWPFRPGSTGSEMIDFRTLDLVVHTWDLSRAIGADEDLPTLLVEQGLSCAQTEWANTVRAAGNFRDVTTSPTSNKESPLWQLLRITGREP